MLGENQSVDLDFIYTMKNILEAVFLLKLHETKMLILPRFRTIFMRYES